jgi:hypothetical protein
MNIEKLANTRLGKIIQNRSYHFYDENINDILNDKRYNFNKTAKYYLILAIYSQNEIILKILLNKKEFYNALDSSVLVYNFMSISMIKLFLETKEFDWGINTESYVENIMCFSPDFSIFEMMIENKFIIKRIKNKIKIYLEYATGYGLTDKHIILLKSVYRKIKIQSFLES